MAVINVKMKAVEKLMMAKSAVETTNITKAKTRKDFLAGAIPMIKTDKRDKSPKVEARSVHLPMVFAVIPLKIPQTGAPPEIIFINKNKAINEKEANSAKSAWKNLEVSVKRALTTISKTEERRM